MVQWIGVFFALLGLVYTGVKDYQKGDIKIPQIKQVLTKQKLPVQYCLMAYDPNLNKVFYLHDNGYWYDFPPKIREHQNQNQETVGYTHGTQGGTQGYYNGQSTATIANPQRY